MPDRSIIRLKSSANFSFTHIFPIDRTDWSKKARWRVAIRLMDRNRFTWISPIWIRKDDQRSLSLFEDAQSEIQSAETVETKIVFKRNGNHPKSNWKPSLAITVSSSMGLPFLFGLRYFDGRSDYFIRLEEIDRDNLKHFFCENAIKLSLMNYKWKIRNVISVVLGCGFCYGFASDRDLWLVNLYIIPAGRVDIARTRIRKLENSNARSAVILRKKNCAWNAISGQRGDNCFLLRRAIETNVEQTNCVWMRTPIQTHIALSIRLVRLYTPKEFQISNDISLRIILEISYCFWSR